MTLSRKVRTFGVGLKSYLSSGMTSTIPMTRVRVLSHVALAGVRKLVAGKPGWAATAPTEPSIESATTTRLRVNEFRVIVPPICDYSEIRSGPSYEPQLPANAGFSGGAEQREVTRATASPIRRMGTSMKDGWR